MQLILPYLYSMAIDAAIVAGMTFAASIAVHASKFLRETFEGRK